MAKRSTQGTAVIRGLDNALGIRISQVPTIGTRWKDNKDGTVNEKNRKMIEADMKPIRALLDDGHTVVFPKDFGSKLNKKGSEATYAYLQEQIKSLGSPVEPTVGSRKSGAKGGKLMYDSNEYRYNGKKIDGSIFIGVAPTHERMATDLEPILQAVIDADRVDYRNEDRDLDNEVQTHDVQRSESGTADEDSDSYANTEYEKGETKEGSLDRSETQRVDEGAVIPEGSVRPEDKEKHLEGIVRSTLDPAQAEMASTDQFVSSEFERKLRELGAEDIKENPKAKDKPRGVLKDLNRIHRQFEKQKITLTLERFAKIPKFRDNDDFWGVFDMTPPPKAKKFSMPGVSYPGEQAALDKWAAATKAHENFPQFEVIVLNRKPNSPPPSPGGGASALGSRLGYPTEDLVRDASVMDEEGFLEGARRSQSVREKGDKAFAQFTRIKSEMDWTPKGVSKGPLRPKDNRDLIVFVDTTRRRHKKGSVEREMVESKKLSGFATGMVAVDQSSLPLGDPKTVTPGSLYGEAQGFRDIFR